MRKSHLILPLVGIFVVLFITRHGVGMMLDSVVLISSARNLIEGHGLSTFSCFGDFVGGFGTISSSTIITFVPLTHFPPLFPSLCAALGSFGKDPIIIARWLNSFLFGANIFLIGIIIYKSGTTSFWTPILGQFLLLTSGYMLQTFSWAYTEPLFIFLSFLGLFYLRIFIENKKYKYLFASSFLISLAFLTRYPGITLILAGIISIMVFSKKNVVKNFYDSAIFALISGSPMTFWMARNAYLYGTSSNRTFAFHPISLTQIKKIVIMNANWFLPSHIIIKRIIAILFVSFMIFAARNIYKNKKLLTVKGVVPVIFNICTYISVVFIITYSLFICFSISFIDKATAIDGRIFLPVYVAWVLIITIVLDKTLFNIEWCKTIKKVYSASIIVLVVYYAFNASIIIKNSYENNLALASKYWQESEMISKIIKLPEGIIIYSNGADAIYILAGKLTNKLPSKVYATSDQRNNNLLQELSIMEYQLKNKQAVIVWFNNINWRHDLLSINELVEKLNLKLIQKVADGSIYGY